MHKSFQDRDNWGMKWVFGTKSTSQYNKSKMDKNHKIEVYYQELLCFLHEVQICYFGGVSKCSVIAHQRQNNKGAFTLFPITCKKELRFIISFWLTEQTLFNIYRLL